MTEGMKPLLGAYGIRYSVKDRRILSDVSLEIDAGTVTALIGPNGSGKSTLMKIIAGVIPSGSPGLQGHVRYHDLNLNEFSPSERAKRIAYIAPGFRAEFPMTAEEAVFLGRICHGGALGLTASREDRDKVEWAMDLCNCWSFRRRDLQSLSSGERQLVALARALTQESKVLLLDETLSKMDLNHQALSGKLVRKLADEGYSVILVAHDLNLAGEWADRCAVLRAGEKVGDGPLNEVLSAKTLSVLYPGAPLGIYPHPESGLPKVYFKSRGSSPEGAR